MTTNYFKTKYFLSPIGPHSNESFARIAAQKIEEINHETTCYFGKNKVFMDTYEFDEIRYKSLRKSSLSFYAFIQKEKEGNRQYFYSQNIDKKSLSRMDLKIAEIAEQIDKQLKESRKVIL